MFRVFIENKIIIFLFIVFLLIYIIAWNRGIQLLYVIAELSLATLILSLIAPYFNLLGITASIKHPKFSHQGDTISITIDLKTSGFFGKYLLEVWLETPFSTNKKHMFFVATLHKKLPIETELLCDIRGVHKTGPLYIKTGFPLGLKVFEKVFRNAQSEVVVFPNPVDVNKFLFSIDESSIHHGDNISKRKGGNDEFVSIREYQQGDSPRHIHWPTTAKKGELIVREYQDILSSSLVIILDLNKSFDIGSNEHTTLEYAITIASSLALHALNNGYRVSLFGYGKEKIELINVIGSQNCIQILETLAYANADGDESYDAAIEHFLGFHQRGGTLILFDNGSGRVSQKLDIFSSKFFKPVLFDIKADSFKQDILNQDFEIQNHSKHSIYTLEKGCDIKRMFS